MGGRKNGVRGQEKWSEGGRKSGVRAGKMEWGGRK